jgi:hypothetical protein
LAIASGLARAVGSPIRGVAIDGSRRNTSDETSRYNPPQRGRHPRLRLREELPADCQAFALLAAASVRSRAAGPSATETSPTRDAPAPSACCTRATASVCWLKVK